MRSSVASGQPLRSSRPPNLVTQFSHEQRVAAFEGYRGSLQDPRLATSEGDWRSFARPKSASFAQALCAVARTLRA
jgi:hypothetical protein